MHNKETIDNFRHRVCIMSIILGIDPGSKITGYGVIHYDKSHINHLGSGCIDTQKNNSYIRLKLIYAGVNRIITQFQPSCCAIEQIFVAINPDSALKLGQARGAAIVAVMNNEIPLFEYSAKKVKQAVVGNGAAEKYQVQYMVRKLLNLPSNPQVDAADALAIAITHCHIIQYTKRVANSKFT